MQFRFDKAQPARRFGQQVIGLFAFVVGGAIVTLALAQPGDIKGDADATAQPAEPSSLVELAAQSFNVRTGEVITLALEPGFGLAQTSAISIAGQQYTMDLEPYSVRAPGYKVFAQVEDGSLVEQVPSPVNTLRGKLVEAPGSQVAGGMMNDGLHARIAMPTGEVFWIEPIASRVAEAAADQYLLYRNEDIISPDGTCGVTEEMIAEYLRVNGENEGGGGDGIAGSAECAELAADADFEYYTAWGSNVTNVENRINLVINTVNTQYESQVAIMHTITAIIVRTAEPDPYTTTVAGDLLCQFRDQWLSNHTSIQRDVAHLFTGKNLSGSTIGIAWLGVICNVQGNPCSTIGSMAFSLVQSDCCGSLGCATDLSAHELGHNWAAQHCSCSGFTMNPSLTCANTFNTFSIDQIVAFRDSRTCLSSCEDGTATLPFSDTFPSTTIDPTLWTGIEGAASNTSGQNEPSPPNSLNLDGNASGGDVVRSAIINATNIGNFKLEYYFQRTGGGNQPEPGDDLVFEFQNSAGAWVEISRQFGNGPAMSTFQYVSVDLPAEASHAEFRLRIRAISNQNGNDDWFVDDVNLTGAIPPNNNNCAQATLVLGGSANFNTAGASTDGPDEPSCLSGGQSQIGNDVWYKYVAPCTGTVTASVCGANYDSKLAVYTSCPSGPGQLLGCADNVCGDDAEVSFQATTNTLYRIRIGGVNGATGSGTLSISCVAAPNCPSDIDGNSTTNVDDLLTVINNWGACAGCPADVNGDGFVNVDDLLLVINGWGPCG